MSIFDLQWLVGDTVAGAEYLTESDTWVLRFKSGAVLSIECLWRVIENGALVATSFDHGHQFGLPEPFDGIAALQRFAQSPVSAATIHKGTADILLQFGGDLSLEIVPTSAGYESWFAVHPKLGQLFASGGGQRNAIPAV